MQIHTPVQKLRQKSYSKWEQIFRQDFLDERGNYDGKKRIDTEFKIKGSRCNQLRMRA